MAMSDDVMRKALTDAGKVIAEYIRPRSEHENPRDVEWTLNRLIEILDNQDLARGISSMPDDAGASLDQFKPDQREQERVLPEG